MSREIILHSCICSLYAFFLLIMLNIMGSEPIYLILIYFSILPVYFFIYRQLEMQENAILILPGISGIDIFMRPTFPQQQVIPRYVTEKINRIITNNSCCVWKDLDSDCAICFDSFQEKDLVVNTCPRHRFHSECLRKNLEMHFTRLQNDNFCCCLCRGNLV